MTLAPENLTDLRTALTDAQACGQRVESVNLRALNCILAHVPEDMTVTVEAGVTLAALQDALRQRGQWLPLDPPHAGKLTIGALLDNNASGPRRFGCGTARDHLIGFKAVLADGRVIGSGGKVVKNVAGYDLHKLFIGARGTLGVIVEATFKLRPLPDTEQFVQARCPDFDHAAQLVETVLDSAITPVVLDLHNLSTLNAKPSTVLVLGFAGSHAEVDWQIAEARTLGITEPTTLAYEQDFWSGSGTPERISVLRSQVCEMLAKLGEVSFAARAGSGLIHHRGGPVLKRDLPNVTLLRRVKQAFDPKNIFPELTP